MAASACEAALALVGRHFTGHVTLGPVTLYGDNAMHFTVQAWVAPLGVYACFQPPVRGWPWKFYASPNATQWAAVLGCGPGFDVHDRERVTRRLTVLRDAPRWEDEAAGIAYAFGCMHVVPRDVSRDHERAEA